MKPTSGIDNISSKEYFETRKEYFEAKIEAADKESAMRFEQTMQLYRDLEQRLAALSAADQADRVRIVELMQQRFIEQDKAILLVDEKNSDHFKVIEQDINVIASTYAQKDAIDKATKLAKEGVDAQFASALRERDEMNIRIREVTEHLMVEIGKSNESSKDRLAIMMTHLEMNMKTQSEHNGFVAANIDARFNGIDKSTQIANNALDKRLDAMNAFREQLKDQAAHFITKGEADALASSYKPTIEATMNRISELEKSKANMDGRLVVAGISVTIAATILSLAVEIIVHLPH